MAQDAIENPDRGAPAPAGPRAFPTTAWTLVEHAAAGESVVRRPALAELLRRYLPALKAHLMHRHQLDEHRAEDMLQGFVCDKVVGRNLLQHVSRGNGKFRTFLLTTLDRYLIDQVRSAAAACRAPERMAGTDVAEAAAGVAGPTAEPASAFDAAWAREAVAEAVRRMKQECERAGRADVWGVFECRVIAPAWDGATPPPYEQLVERFGLKTPAHAANVLVTAKRMFQRNLRDVVGEYAGDGGDVEQELRDLRAILAGAAGVSIGRP